MPAPGPFAAPAGTAADALVRFDGVSRIHGRGAQAVRALGPVSFTVAAGEMVAIMGPSGSGKSTLLALAGALDVPTGGQVRVGGHDLATLAVAALAALRRSTIGYVFQELNLLPGLTAIENVSLPLELDGTPLASARRQAMQALSDLGLEALSDRFPDDLSGGEQQRVAIARAFVGPRRLLLADEPTGALDSASGQNVMRLLRAQCDRGCTVLLVTHNPEHADWADRVLHLRDGAFLDEGLIPSAGSVTDA